MRSPKRYASTSNRRAPEDSPSAILRDSIYVRIAFGRVGGFLLTLAALHATSKSKGRFLFGISIASLISLTILLAKLTGYL
jgi:hypothetical protein